MRKLKIALLMSSFFFTATLFSQEKEVKEVISAFAKAGDKNDAKKLANYLDENYRIMMNRLFGSENVSIMNKTDYLAKIESKEYGGDNRTVSFEDVVMNGTTASVKATLKGEKMSFTSLFILVQNKNGEWKIISDAPMVK